MSRQKIIVILGQTATGKSDLAVKLAKKFGGEVVSADSRQVYRGLNLGTGKITRREMRGVPHHLLDIADPRRYFSVAQYQKLANRAVKNILSREKLPIICGGTGLYIDAAVSGKIFPEVKPDEKLRKRLNGKTTKELHEMLQKLDPRRAKEIDKNNPRRLVRAIEIARMLGRVPAIKYKPLSYDALKIGLRPSEKELRQKIHNRLIERMKKGMIAEAYRLHNKGLSWKRMEELGLEYRYLAKYLNNEITKKEMLNKLETEIWRYAKRQKIWFKKDKKIYWVDPFNNSLPDKAAEITRHFLGA